MMEFKCWLQAKIQAIDDQFGGIPLAKWTKYRAALCIHLEYIQIEYIQIEYIHLECKGGLNEQSA